LKEKIGAILEAAEKTGALDKVAFAELPPGIANQVRTG
jgi:hypothetical protein